MSHTHTHCDSAYCCADFSHQRDVCRLKQTCTPKGAAQKYLTTVTDVMILIYAVGLDVARGTQSNTQGVWPCKLPIDSLPLQLFAKSPKLMSVMSKSLVETFRMRSQGRQMNMLWCNTYFHHKKNCPLNTTCNRDIWRVALNLKK